MEKKLNPWQVFKIRKELSTQLKIIIKKVINKEELNDTEIEFLKLISKGE